MCRKLRVSLIARIRWRRRLGEKKGEKKEYVTRSGEKEEDDEEERLQEADEPWRASEERDKQRKEGRKEGRRKRRNDDIEIKWKKEIKNNNDIEN